MEQIAFFLSGVFVKYFDTSDIFRDTSLCKLVEETLLPVIDNIFNTILKCDKMRMRIMKHVTLSHLRSKEITGTHMPCIPHSNDSSATTKYKPVCIQM